ncbi:Uncharacterized protein HZ326_23962 [Fusarium oxysporum f. sp. albedinis]|nr:Uncharacterized protein HZ326_23962 [Fusarium oxysporum f. sp. albedinis]
MSRIALRCKSSIRSAKKLQKSIWGHLGCRKSLPGSQRVSLRIVKPYYRNVTESTLICYEAYMHLCLRCKCGYYATNQSTRWLIEEGLRYNHAT